MLRNRLKLCASFALPFAAALTLRLNARQSKTDGLARSPISSSGAGPRLSAGRYLFTMSSEGGPAGISG
jgi:hypothetical protein